MVFLVEAYVRGDSLWPDCASHRAHAKEGSCLRTFSALEKDEKS